MSPASTAPARVLSLRGPQDDQSLQEHLDAQLFGASSVATSA